MKKLTIILLLLSALSKAQAPLNDTVTVYQNSPGKELFKATRHFYIGVTISVLGSALGIIALDDTDSTGVTQTGKSISYAGFGISFIGLIVMLESVSHIGKAGQMMEDRRWGYHVNADGVGVHYNF